MENYPREVRQWLEASGSSQRIGARRARHRLRATGRWKFLTYMLLAFALLALGEAYLTRPRTATVPLSEIIRDAYLGKVSSIVISASDVTATYSDGTTKRAFGGGSIDPVTLTIIIAESGRPAPTLIYSKPDPVLSGITRFGSWIISTLLPLGLAVLLVLYVLRQTSPRPGANSSAGIGILSNLGVSPRDSSAPFAPRMFTGNRHVVTFADIGGCKPAKFRFQSFVEHLKYPDKYAVLGAYLPAGALLYGPPGCGKTLLARAVAGEAGVPFLSVTGPEFIADTLGAGAARVRTLFDMAKRNAPCIVFIDEIDVMATRRSPEGPSSASLERSQTLQQLLAEMDGFDSYRNVFVLAATSRLDLVDEALLRPGRFESLILIDRPSQTDREEILLVQTGGKPLEEDVDVEALARMTTNFTGADLASLANEAAIIAAQRNKKTISMREFEDALARVAAEFVSSRDR